MKYVIGKNNMIRNADDAVESIEKLCRQYGWSFTVRLIDADTCGKIWAECLIDRDGGINYNERIVSVRCSQSHV